MASAADYVRILEQLGIDTDQLWPKLGRTSKTLRKRSGERYPGLYFNHRKGVCYFTLNPNVATVQVAPNLWQDVTIALEVPERDRSFYNIVPNPGQERQALRSLLT